MKDAFSEQRNHTALAASTTDKQHEWIIRSYLVMGHACSAVQECRRTDVAGFAVSADGVLRGEICLYFRLIAQRVVVVRVDNVAGADCVDPDSKRAQIDSSLVCQTHHRSLDGRVRNVPPAHECSVIGNAHARHHTE